MFLRFFLISLLFTLTALAQKGGKELPMKPVVPEKLIPPSPVLTVDQALKSFSLEPGFVIEAVVAEPLVEKPVCLDFDAAGRMWVCEMRGFMPDVDGKGESVPEGRIVILEDSDKDGKVDKRTVFLEKLLLPRAITVFGDGVLFMDEHNLCWIKRHGDQAEGGPVTIDSEISGQGNVEHKPNGLLPNLDNRYYLAKSDKRLHRIGDRWEIEPTTFRGQWGIARDDFGRLYHNNNSTLLFGDLLVPDLLKGNPGVRMKIKDYTQLGSNRVWPARVNPGINRAYMSKAHGFDGNVLDPVSYKLISTTAASGMAIYRGTNFPQEWYGTAFTTEPSCNLVKAIRIEEKNGMLKGSHPTGNREFLASTDERFRPVNAYNAPDGSLYILDMYHGIIQHDTYMTTYLREQILSRGLDVPGFGHGRIYRIRSTTGKLDPPEDLSVLQDAYLVRLLAHPNSWQRETAQRLLVERKDITSIPLLVEHAASGSAVTRIHAIWTLEGMGALKAGHLISAIQSTDPKLQSSALWAGTRLPPEEFAKLEPVLITANPAAPEVAPYLARALGPLGKPAAFARLANLIEVQRKTRFVREAAISGLDQYETAFRDSQMKDSKDREFLSWLEKGAKVAEEKKTAGPTLAAADLASFERGKVMFHGAAACFGCHSADGEGMPNLGPPLDESQWVTGKPETLVKILLHGMTGPVEVDGETYTPAADMPGLAMNPVMTDQALADLATYIRNAWSNHAPPVSAVQVQKQRELHKNRAGRLWTAKELMKSR